MIRLYGYETAPQTRTFDTYHDVDCFNYSDLHDYLKFLKWGYGKVNDHVAREIRLKRLTAAEGVARIDSYLYRKPQNLGLFLTWIGMTERGFQFVIDQHRSPVVWERDEDWNWDLKTKITTTGFDETFQAVALKKKENCDFALTPSKKPNVTDDKYILIGKGYVD
jgi:hypothetical protein